MSLVAHTIPIHTLPRLRHGFRWCVEQIGCDRVRVQLVQTIAVKTGFFKNRLSYQEQVLADEVVEYSTPNLCAAAQTMLPLAR